MSATRIKHESEARQQEEKRIADRKRGIIVLVLRYFLDLGYTESTRQITNETGVSMEKVDVADNIDLWTVVQQFEEFYEMKFQRRPKLYRVLKSDEAKLTRGPSMAQALPSLAAGTSERRSSSQRESSVTRKEKKASGKPPRHPNDAGPETEGKPPEDASPGIAGGIVGTQVNAAPEKPAEKKPDAKAAANDFYDNRVMKPMLPPGMAFDSEYRDLAANVSRDIVSKNPGVSWTDIVGLEIAKKLLKEAVVMPIKYPQLFTGLLTPWKGILLFGPPGTGKTLLAKAVATECQTTFFNISASTIVSKWRGDSEKLIRVLFDLARHHQPSTIFIDELDSIISSRGGGADGEHEGSRRMKTELLIQMDGLERDANDLVFLLAASNLPWDLDSAMLRRLEKRILVDLPCHAGRRALLTKLLPEGVAEEALDYDLLSERTEGWSGADIRLLCKEAAMHPLRRLMDEIEAVEAHPEVTAKRPAELRVGGRMASQEEVDIKLGAVSTQDVEQALVTTRPAPAAHVSKYREWQASFGSS
mmetsp:Transcript_45588/g.120526  ORF Transcript_45588/g.120526 Transcript_45588/m.120526 type:complete len:531 (-) Transcript_45588:2-1594(-)